MKRKKQSPERRSKNRYGNGGQGEKKHFALKATAETPYEEFKTTFRDEAGNIIHTTIKYEKEYRKPAKATLRQRGKSPKLRPLEITLKNGRLNFRTIMITKKYEEMDERNTWTNLEYPLRTCEAEMISTQNFRDLYKTHEARSHSEVQNELSVMAETIQERYPRIMAHLRKAF